MERLLTFTVNGQSRSVTTDPARPLLDVLREEFHLTGTKYGCGEGQCRACTVLLDGDSVAACVTPVSEADKKTVVTIEGLARDGRLHSVQQAFLDHGAFQCGYCSPGMILETAALLNRKPRPSENDVLAKFQRHICRCGSYVKIRQAIRQALAQP